jgi:cytochrome c2
MEPKAFRPSTRMPQFFGLHSHFLPPENGNGSHAAGRQVAAAQGNGNGNGNGQAVNGSGEPSETELARTQRYEQAEALAITHYLLAVSRPVAYVTQSPEVTEDASAERGKYLFQTRGCLACHEHKDFPQGKESQGPDLSNIGSKLVTSKGRKWLYSWLRNPTHYSGRTLMPDLFLTPIVEKDGKITDPAADIALFLLESKAAFVPQRVPPLAEVEPTVYELAVEELRGVFPKQQAERYIEHGVPTDMAAELKGDEIELLGPTSDENRGDKTLRYLGRRAISKYGCFGCHDIPGFETAKPIGTGLADWGRKDASRLAFEQIARYVTRVHGSSRGGAHEGEEPHLDLLNMPPAQQDDALFLAALLGHKREGFLWQKLHEPRSFDYEKTRNKRYNERLRMPQFPFTEEQIESVMTFVLGLTADPPAEKFLYQPNPRQAAILEGQRVLEKYNCGGCHTLQHESFEFEYDPTFVSDQGFVDFASERKFPDNEYPFFQLHAAAEQIKQSQAVDARGLARARVFASRVVDENGEVQVGEDADKEGNEISLHFLQLWEPALINGQWWLTSDQVPVPANWFTRDGHRSAVGGSLARLIHPVVLATERQVNPAAKYADAWGFVPPPLVGEGQKVQTAWLHAFLLDPYPIRPATVLRMPRFNMTSAEAGAIVNYFAAKDKVEFPYEYDPRTRQAHLESRESAYPGRLDDALRIITNGNYCVKCHYVGDFVPAGAAAAHAPNLDRVYQRLRPEFLRNWLANPKRILPYTGMPVNFQLDKPLDPKLFAGDVGRLIKEGHSADQLEAVVDFLLNYDVYMKQQKSIKPLVTPAAPMTTPAAGG